MTKEQARTLRELTELISDMTLHWSRAEQTLGTSYGVVEEYRQRAMRLLEQLTATAEGSQEKEKTSP